MASSTFQILSSSPNASRRMDYAIPAAAAFMGGASFSAGKIVVTAMPPLWAAALRFSMTACLLLAWALWREPGTLAALRRHALALAGLGSIGVAAFNGLLFLGLKQSSPVNAALITALCPVATPCLAAVFLREPLGARKLVCAAVAVGGVAIVLLGGGAHLTAHAGDVWLLLANLAWGLYCVFSRSLSRQVKPMVLTCGTTLFGAPLLCLTALATGQVPDSVAWTPQVAGAMAFLVVFGSAVTYLFWQISLARLGAGTTSLFFSLIPVFAVAVSACLGTPVEAHQVAGGAVVLAGVVASLWPRAAGASA